MNENAPVATPERSPRTGAVYVALAAIVIALLIVQLAPSPQVAPAISPIDSPAPAAANIIGTEAFLDFALRDINGVDVNLSGFKGKVILINFWATWCPPCRAEIPGLVKLQSAYRDDLVVVGLLVQDPIGKRTKPFGSAMKMNYPVLDANDRSDIENAFGGPFWGIPATILIGRDGRFATKHADIATTEELETEIRSLL